MKICSNNQQAEFFIALESAELIISEFFLRKYKTVTKLSRYKKNYILVLDVHFQIPHFCFFMTCRK